MGLLKSVPSILWVQMQAAPVMLVRLGQGVRIVTACIVTASPTPTCLGLSAGSPSFAPQHLSFASGLPYLHPLLSPALACSGLHKHSLSGHRSGAARPAPVLVLGKPSPEWPQMCFMRGHCGPQQHVGPCDDVMHHCTPSTAAPPPLPPCHSSSI